MPAPVAYSDARRSNNRYEASRQSGPVRPAADSSVCLTTAKRQHRPRASRRSLGNAHVTPFAQPSAYPKLDFDPKKLNTPCLPHVPHLLKRRGGAGSQGRPRGKTGVI
ncbi:hypothetical protein E2C01_068716 [Portunus trituberculatus]|uniref:Uncharacterized protein n=1 Tax=Portunus trituberculatus TaxID=210409 RepID=A0A5B7HX74_PORTR|nr:hypothetical protein [Portunus trituberculatus]